MAQLKKTLAVILSTPAPFKYGNSSQPDDLEDLECRDPIITDTLFYPLMLIPAVLIVITFSFTQKRRKQFLSVLNGRPGLIHPMDMLTKSDRISYMCALGATANLLYKCILDRFQAIDYDGPLVMKTVMLLISVIIFGIVHFPVFACLTTGSLLGLGTGSLYIWMLTVIEMIRMIDCDNPTNLKVMFVLRGLPNILCLLYLSVRIPFRFYQDFPYRKGIFSNTRDTKNKQYFTLEDLRNSNIGHHIRDLLKKPEEEKPRFGFTQNFIGFVLDNTYRPHPCFRYSARFLSTLFLALLLLYAVTFEVYRFIFNLHELLMDSIHPMIPPEHQPESKHLFQYIIRTTLASTTLSILVGLYGLIRMFTKYRETMFALNRGELKHLWRNKTNDSILLSAMKYSGYQVVSVVWGFFIQNLIFLIFCSIIAVMIWAFKHGYSSWFTDGVVPLCASEKEENGKKSRFTIKIPKGRPIPFWALIINVAQILMTKFTFIGHKKHLVLDNRRVLFVASYFIFFYNIFLGIFSSLLRIIKSIVIGAFLVPRLDCCVLPQDYDSLDPGYMTYVGFMRLENDHNHPVMLAFLRLLHILARDRRNAGARTSVGGGATGGGDGGGGGGGGGGGTGGSRSRQVVIKIDIDKFEKSRKHRAAVFKWSTLYTLINNPDLRMDRKGYIQKIKRARELGLAIPKSDTYVPISDDILKEAQDCLDDKQANVIGKIAHVAGDKFDGIKNKIHKRIDGIVNRRNSSDDLSDSSDDDGSDDERADLHNRRSAKQNGGHGNIGKAIVGSTSNFENESKQGRNSECPVDQNEGRDRGDISTVFAGNKRRRRKEREAHSNNLEEHNLGASDLLSIDRASDEGERKSHHRHRQHRNRDNDIDHDDDDDGGDLVNVYHNRRFNRDDEGHDRNGERKKSGWVGKEVVI